MNYDLKNKNGLVIASIIPDEALSPFDIDINGTIYCYLVGDQTDKGFLIKDFVAVICNFNNPEDRPQIATFSKHFPVIFSPYSFPNELSKIDYIKDNIDKFLGLVKTEHDLQCYSAFIEYFKMHKIQPNHTIPVDTMSLDQYLWNIQGLKKLHKDNKKKIKR
jgi:hypothetical protein